MKLRRKAWIVSILSVLLVILGAWGGYHFLGRARQGIQDGPNTLLCLLDYEDASTPKAARAKFLLVNTRSILPFHSEAVSHHRETSADSRGKVSLLWSDNSGVWLNEIQADGREFTRDPVSRVGREPFWDGYTIGATTNGRSTTAIAVHHLARIRLDRSASTFSVEHVRDVPRQ